MIDWPKNTTTEQLVRYRGQLEESLRYGRERGVPEAETINLWQRLINIEVNNGFQILHMGQEFIIRYNFTPQLASLEGESNDARRARFDEADAKLTNLEWCINNARRANVIFHPAEVIAYINKINNSDK